jgi:nitrous oxidase accessory protein
MTLGLAFALQLGASGVRAAGGASGGGDLQRLIDGTPEGGMLRLAGGTYRGHFVIGKPMTLIASRDAILDGGGTGTVVRVTSPRVIVDGLIVQGSGSVIGSGDSAVTAEKADGFRLQNCVLRETLFGIQLLDSKDAVIDGNEVSSFTGYPMGRRGDLVKIWYSPGTRVTRNHIHDGRDVLVWYSDRSTIQRNVIERMRYALHYMYSHQSAADHNTFRLSSVGIYDMYGNGLTLSDNEIVSNRGPSGYGVALKEADRVRLSGNRILGNRIGLQLDNSPLSPPINPEDTTLFTLNRLARNDIGVFFVGSGSGSVFLRNDFIDNWQQVSTGGLQKGMTTWTGNYWSDYRGVDPGHHGIGIIPYTADSIVGEVTDRFESFRLFSFGPAMLALEFTQRLIPWVRSEPKAIDPIPAMRPHLEPPAGAGGAESARGRWMLVAFSGALLGGVVGARRRLVL